ncbi:hypothetical protein NUW58_g5692 [Xylaria curta]|uniref:Uncharacterized protein n=1 Tax=Xylaria curta TaxID=42375 RepID=A0ACC1P0E7_9PEZI|nr:hypothetical protein NUW58_g5692 [Xylaria curta]
MDDGSSQASTAAGSSKDYGHYEKIEPRMSDDEQDGFLHERSAIHRNRFLKVWWIPATAFLWVISLIVTWKLSSSSVAYHNDSFQFGYSTDLEPLKSQIETLRYKFVGDLDWDENGTLYRPPTPGHVKYVGQPSPEIDAAWAHLIPGEAMDLIGDEAKTIEGTTFQKPGGWWVQGVEVFHQLHCLNIIRKTIDIDYYGINEMDPATYRLNGITSFTERDQSSAASRIHAETSKRFEHGQPHAPKLLIRGQSETAAVR